MYRRLWSILLCLGLLSACHKREFLNTIPDSQLIVPTTLDAFEQLLSYQSMTETGILVELSTSDYYLTSTSLWQSWPVQERNAYTWAPDLYEGAGKIMDWNTLYQQVLYANVVLEGLAKMTPAAQTHERYAQVKGWALFLRGFAFFNLAQAFAKPYDLVTSHSDMGIPLRTEADITVVSTRPTVEQTYARIITDLNEALPLLPTAVQANHLNRPCRPAGFALLARVQLVMHNYTEALKAANKAFEGYNQLMDYNELTNISHTNRETLYQSYLSLTSNAVKVLVSRTCFVDSMLYRSYDDNDLRKAKFFALNAGKPFIAGAYSGLTYLFSGLATDEVVLIQAECLIRNGEVDKGLDRLDTLLKNRWRKGTYVPFSVSDQDLALKSVLEERRKELCFRGLRWQDLRRLNKEGAGINLERALNGERYTLPANSSRWVLPVPPDEIAASGIPQNIRIID